eukprot:scaffold120421_cov19-Tisochrysis_lutea.AAC.3
MAAGRERNEASKREKGYRKGVTKYLSAGRASLRLEFFVAVIIGAGFCRPSLISGRNVTVSIMMLGCKGRLQAYKPHSN